MLKWKNTTGHFIFDYKANLLFFKFLLAGESNITRPHTVPLEAMTVSR